MRGSLALLLLLGLIFAYGLWRLFDLRFASGDIYPPYSSLRADPQGSRALFESLADLPGFTVERNYRPLDKLPQRRQTLFYIGGSAFAFENSSEDELKLFEGLAVSGSRVVIAFRTANEEAVPNGPPASIQTRWGLRFKYLKLPQPPDRERTALVIAATDLRWSGNPVLERRFGAGSIILMPLAYPLSNEALQQHRDTALLTKLVGRNQRIVFEETHLGVTESGSVAGLARKYRLQPLILALLLLAGLFVWKNSSSLLPPRETPHDAAVVASTQDAYAGLANLLRRNIPKSRLLAVCLEELEKSRMHYSEQKMAQVRALVKSGGDPVALYRQIGAVLAERK